MKERVWRGTLLFVCLAVLLTLWAPAAAPERLIPVGSTVGIRLEADGLVVVGFDEKRPSAAKEFGLRKGDVIKTVNGTEAEDAEHFKSLLAAGGGGPLTLGILRKGKHQDITLEPTRAGGGYALGVYLRDSMAGIGTVTFYDPEEETFGALGHGVNDLQTMVLLPLEKGEIVPSSVTEVKKGTSGSPGVLRGEFDGSKVLGTVESNTDHGIFGHGAAELCQRQPMPVAKDGEIHTGKATILSNVDGTQVREYTVEITKLFPLERDSGRNLLLTITDQRLLKATGGIVQGMSGSPILQDGKLVGAVTHVLVDNPVCGYGIFIENMLGSMDLAS